MTNGQTIHQWDFHGYGSQKWIIEHHGNGYYFFRTAYTATPYYLSWSGNSNSGADYPIVLYNFSSVNDVVLWRIFSDPDGLLHFIPKDCEEMMYCLAVERNSTDNGIRLMQSLLYSGQAIEKRTFIRTPNGDHPPVFNLFLDKNLITENDIRLSNDGMCYVLLKPLSDILLGDNINTVSGLLVSGYYVFML